MNISANTVVSIRLKAYNGAQELVEELSEPVDYLHGGYDNLLPALEAALEGKAAGDTLVVELSQEQAFGPYQPELLTQEKRSAFPAELEVGDYFEAEHEQDVIWVRVTKFDANWVTLDANPPLAGQDLSYHIQVMAVRPATEDEIEHGHSHDDEPEA